MSLSRKTAGRCEGDISLFKNVNNPNNPVLGKQLKTTALVSSPFIHQKTLPKPMRLRGGSFVSSLPQT